MVRQRKTIILSNEGYVMERLWDKIENIAADAIERNGVFRIGLSGGSLVRYLAMGAGGLVNTDWSKWQLFFCDERYVELNDRESNFGQYMRGFLPETKLHISQFIRIDPSKSLEDCARDYEEKILNSFGVEKVGDSFVIFLFFWRFLDDFRYSLQTTLFFLFEHREQFHHSMYWY